MSLFSSISVATNISQQSNNPPGNRSASSSIDSHHFQSCRETYAIVTSNVLYIDLVRTVLLQLGYSAMDLINAKGKFLNSCFQIKVVYIAVDIPRNPSPLHREQEMIGILQLVLFPGFARQIFAMLILYLFA